MSIFRNTVGVGVSVTRDAICSVALSVADGKAHLISATRISLSEEAVRALGERKESPALSGAIERALEGAPSGAPITLAIWESEVYSHIFEPPPEKGDLLKVAKEEAGKSFPDDVSSLAIDAHMVGDGRAVVAGMNQSLCNFLSHLVPPPDTIEPESFALVRALIGGKDAKSTVYVAVGLRDAYAVVYDAKGFAETVVLEESDRSVDDILAEKLTTTREVAEALRKSDGVSGTKKGSVGSILSAEYRGAKKTIEDIVARYKKNGSPIERIVFSGVVMDTPGLAEFLSKSLKIEVVLADPWADIGDVEKKVQRNTELSAAVGAALRSLLPGESMGISFAAERVSPRIQERSLSPAQSSRPQVSTAKNILPVSLDGVKNIFSKIVFVVGVIALMVGGGMWGYRWYQAAPAQKQETEIALAVEKNMYIGAASAPSDALRGSMRDFTRVATGTFLVTAPATRDARAVGTVTLKNASSQNIILRKGTRLLHSSGVIALLDQRTSLSMGKEVSVKATTEIVGSSANIPPGTFTIPGLPVSLHSNVTGASDTPFSGGVVYERRVSDIDKGHALDALRLRVYTEALIELAGRTPEDIYLENPIGVESVSSQFSLDTDPKLFHATGDFAIKTAMLSHADVNNALQAVLQSKVGSEHASLYEISLPHISFMRMLGPDMARIVISAEGTRR